MPLNTYNAATNLFVALPGPVSPPGFLTDADLNAAKAHSDAQAVAAMAAAAAAQSAAVSAAAAAAAANTRVIPPAYTLPPATTAALGGFKPGTTLATTADGTTEVVGQTVAQITTVTTPPGTPYVVLFQADGTPAKITLTALQALAGWSGGAGAGVPTLTLTMPTGVQPGTSYTINGTFSNDGTSPVLTISVDAGAFGAFPAGSSATSGLITLSMPGIATGTHTVQVRDGNGVLSNTVSFAVTAVETLTVTTPGAQVAGTGFAVAGTYANGTPATLDYSLDGGTTWTAASGPTISGGSYSIPGVVVPAANASQTVRVRDHGAQSVVGVSGAFAVTAAAGAGPALTMTGDTYAAAPAGFGQQLTGGSGTATITLPAGTSWGIEMDFTASAAPLSAGFNLVYTNDGFGFNMTTGGNINGSVGTYATIGPAICDGVKHKLAVFYHATGTAPVGTVVYVDGAQVAANNYIANGANPTITVAAYPGAAIDNLRISNNIRITGAYTPSTAPLTRDASTVVLYAFDGSGVSQ